MEQSIAHNVWWVRRRLLLVLAGMALGALAAVSLWRLAAAGLPACEREVRFGDPRRGVESCLASYRATGNDLDRLWAAKAYLRSGQIEEANRLAQQLTTSTVYGDAHQILSYVAVRDDSQGRARMHATIALVAHVLRGDALGRASDATLLSQIAWKAGDFTAALSAANDALALLQGSHETHKKVVAYLARADALRRLGDHNGAAATLASAAAEADEPCDQMWARVKNALCLIASGQYNIALVELKAAEADHRCPSRDFPLQIGLNEALLLQWKAPGDALAKLDEVERVHGDKPEAQLIRAYLAADRGALGDAEHHLARAAGLEPPDGDWPWVLLRARAELSELRGGPLGDVLAEYYYRSAIAHVAALRATARSRSAYLVSSHRDPYDALIALLARQGRWRDALEVILELDASDMLRATADEAIAGDGAPLAEAVAIRAAPRATVDQVLEAWRSRDLVIAIARSRRHMGAGRDRMYRLRIAGGQVSGDDMGDASLARIWADTLHVDPANREAARGLGKMLIPEDRDERPLHVLAIGALAKAPLAALRNDLDALHIAERPLIKVLALLATRPESTGTGPAAIIADPLGDLRHAATEGRLVAGALGPRARLSGLTTGMPATRARLWEARDAELLHIAGHVVGQPRGRALLLADGEVGPGEIVQHGLAPRIAVLAGCGSAAAFDDEGWGSIAAALLEAGTAVVIATDRSIDDRISLSLIRELYAQPDWRTDPARALARVQSTRDTRDSKVGDDETSPRAWAAFSVLGRPPQAPASAW
jgi:tetratricopeptide (TPR) repeat protein